MPPIRAALLAACVLPLSGDASWYGTHWAGRRMANGERFVPTAMVAASPCLPFGSRILVTRRDTGRQVIVRIADRGPYVRHRVLDLSLGAARSLGMVREGVAPVRIEAVPQK